ncbi:hypothetical protein [Legionella sp. 227]|uniref:hypothetical protein n=1 Tax=Legionella sp. 227 TaxID=3367288 RepID=UPI00370D58C4
MQDKDQHEKEVKESPLTLDQKRNICVKNIQTVMDMLLKEYPDQFFKSSSIQVASSKRPKSGLTMSPDGAAGVGFLAIMKSGEAQNVIKELFKDFTYVRPALRYGEFNGVAYFSKNTDAELDLLLKKSEQLKSLYGPFDMKLFMSLASPVPASTRGFGFYDQTSKKSALEDENIAGLVAKIFEGKSMHAVKIEADLISFKGKPAEVEEVFKKAKEVLKERGLSGDGIISNLESTAEITFNIAKVAAELNKPKEESGLGLTGS